MYFAGVQLAVFPAAHFDRNKAHAVSGTGH
jgi:hypothetical protein